MRSVMMMMVLSSLVACVPPPKAPEARLFTPEGVRTSIEKVTVTVKDAQGNVMRIEEKEQIVQEYSAASPVEMKQAKSPPLRESKIVTPTESPTPSTSGDR